jgi:hypothetical protein
LVPVKHTPLQQSWLRVHERPVTKHCGVGVRGMNVGGMFVPMSRSSPPQLPIVSTVVTTMATARAGPQE